MKNKIASSLDEISLPDEISRRLLIVGFDNSENLLRNADVESSKSSHALQQLSAGGLVAESKAKMRESFRQYPSLKVEDFMLNGSLIFLLSPKLAELFTYLENDRQLEEISDELCLENNNVWSSSLALAKFCDRIDLSEYSYSNDLLDLWDLWCLKNLKGEFDEIHKV